MNRRHMKMGLRDPIDGDASSFGLFFVSHVDSMESPTHAIDMYGRLWTDENCP